MHWCHREPTLDEILSDSITKAVMEADGVDPQELAASLKQAVRSPVLRTLQWGPWSTEQEIARMIKRTGVRSLSTKSKGERP
jgi:hypothetical protein